jgi:hypothetical protein
MKHPSWVTTTCFYCWHGLIVGSSLWFAYLVGMGLYEGKVTFISSQGNGTAYFGTQPGLYWYGIAFYSVCCAGCAIASWMTRDIDIFES